MLVTTFLTLFLDVFSLQGKDASKLVGNWFQLFSVYIKCPNFNTCVEKQRECVIIFRFVDNCFSFKACVVFESLRLKRSSNLIGKIRCNGCTAYQNVCVISEYSQPTSYFQAAIRLLLNFQESVLFVLIPSQLSPSPFSTPKY